MNKINWEGVFPAMLTPFTADDKLDLDMFEKNVNAQLEAGIEGAYHWPVHWVKAVRLTRKKRFSCWYMPVK